jgi:hypothetical protein
LSAVGPGCSAGPSGRGLVGSQQKQQQQQQQQNKQEGEI